MTKARRIKHIDLIKKTKEATTIAVLAVAEQGVTIAKPLTPVDKGQLRGSINAQPRSRTTAVYGSNVEYAPHVEFGHKTSSGNTVPAQSFLRISADILKNKASGIFARAFRRAF